MTNLHYSRCAFLVWALSGCQPGLIGDAPGTTPDSGSSSDSGSSTTPDAFQPPNTPDAGTPDAEPPPPCIEGDDRVLDPDTGHCYMAFRTLVPWTQARSSCENIGAHLVDVTSSAENGLVLQLAGAVDDHWMGGNDSTLEGAWVWSSGASWVYSNWRAGEPNNSTGTDTVNGEDCNVIEAARGGSWDDRPCTLRMYNYICERE